MMSPQDAGPMPTAGYIPKTRLMGLSQAPLLTSYEQANVK